MADNLIQIEFNPPDLLQRMRRYPKKLDDELEDAMDESLTFIHSKVPQYPNEPPGSTYVRTLTLGRSLGVGGGRANVREVKRLGQGKYEGRFGTNLYYAPYVIGTGEGGGKKQAKHMSHWWTMRNVKERSEQGIQKIFDKMAEKLVKFLGG